MKLVKRIQECTSIADIDRLGLRLRPTFRKTLETAILLSNHPDKTQRDYGAQFMRTVLQEAERGEDAVTAPSEADGLKTKGDHFVKEEELDNHNPESGNAGSDQSTDNVEPYPQVADTSDDGEKGMEKTDGEDQMKEAGFPMGGGMPPQQPNGMPPMGMEPGVAGEMGAQMPQLPPMNTNQMMRQMQYTLNETLKRYVLPLRNEIRVQRETIKKLSMQIQEVQVGKGAMKLDIAHVRDHAMARSSNPIHETVTNVIDPKGEPVRIHSKIQEMESARSDITEMDKMLRSK